GLDGRFDGHLDVPDLVGELPAEPAEAGQLGPGDLAARSAADNFHFVHEASSGDGVRKNRMRGWATNSGGPAVSSSRISPSPTSHCGGRHWVAAGKSRSRQPSSSTRLTASWTPCAC